MCVKRATLVVMAGSGRGRATQRGKDGTAAAVPAPPRRRSLAVLEEALSPPQRGGDALRTQTLFSPGNRAPFPKARREPLPSPSSSSSTFPHTPLRSLQYKAGQLRFPPPTPDPGASAYFEPAGLEAPFLSTLPPTLCKRTRICFSSGKRKSGGLIRAPSRRLVIPYPPPHISSGQKASLGP